jgi:hypothetical protein
MVKAEIVRGNDLEAMTGLATPHARKPWQAPQVIVAEGRETDHNIPFGGTPDGSLTSIHYAYGS